MSVPAGRMGAFTLGAPGTRVRESADRLVIGNKPGALHWTVGIGVPLGTLAIAAFAWPYLKWLGLIFPVLFGLPATLVPLNKQRWEVSPGWVRARGSAAGVAQHKDYRVPAGATVRVDATRMREGVDSAPHRPMWQASVRTDELWVAVAESTDEAQVRAFAERLARAAGVPVEERAPRA